MSTPLALTEKSLPDNCYVFKHSATCSESARAAGVVRAHEFDLPLYWITVQESRDLSAWIAEHYETRHESPQLLKIEGGKVTQNLHHFKIQEDAIS